MARLPPVWEVVLPVHVRCVCVRRAVSGVVFILAAASVVRRLFRARPLIGAGFLLPVGWHVLVVSGVAFRSSVYDVAVCRRAPGIRCARLYFRLVIVPLCAAIAPRSRVSGGVAMHTIGRVVDHVCLFGALRRWQRLRLLARCMLQGASWGMCWLCEAPCRLVPAFRVACAVLLRVWL